MDLDLDKLAEFLVIAKNETYANDGVEVEIPERLFFKELVFSDGEWEYRDSYSGYFMAPGQEVVMYKENPVWAMAYAGGMLPGHIRDKVLAIETFEHLKSALKEISIKTPFRGPRMKKFDDGWTYFCNIDGNISNFKGSETIMKNMGAYSESVFRQNFIGGLIIGKE
jgi:hypothetical protein